MSTPEEEIRFAEAFNELGEAAELMVEPPAVTAIRGEVRRRRVARVSVAAVAALALIAPATWMLQQAATAEEPDRPVAVDPETAETTADAETPKPQEPTPTMETTPATGSEETEPPPLLSYEDLVGTTFDLPSFMPGTTMVDDACVPDGAVLHDGMERGAEHEGGRINLLEVVHAPLTEGGHPQNIAFLVCRFAEASAYQAVVIELDENDNWVAETQLIASKPNADSPYDIAPADDYGVLIGVAEHYACCAMDPDEFDYWVEKAVLDEDGEVVRTEVGEGGLPDLSVAADATQAEPNVWDVQVTVANVGDVTSGSYDLWVCADAAEVEEADFPFGDCFSDGSMVVEDIGPIAPGDEHTTTYRLTLIPSDMWMDGAHLVFSIEPNTTGAAGIVRDATFADNQASYSFAE